MYELGTEMHSDSKRGRREEDLIADRRVRRVKAAAIRLARPCVLQKQVGLPTPLVTRTIAIATRTPDTLCAVAHQLVA